MGRGGEASTSGAGGKKSRSMYKRLAFLREEGDREWHRLGNAIVRGAGAGLCLKGGLNLLSWILALFNPARRRYVFASPFKILFEQVVDTLRYTLFLGSLSGVYVGTDEIIAVSLGRKKWVTLSQVSHQFALDTREIPLRKSLHTWIQYNSQRFHDILIVLRFTHFKPSQLISFHFWNRWRSKTWGQRSISLLSVSFIDIFMANLSKITFLKLLHYRCHKNFKILGVNW